MKQLNFSISNASLAHDIHSLFLLALCMGIILLHSAPITAQTVGKPNLGKVHGTNAISFTVSHEANVRYYDVEAANDTIHFETIGKIKSRGNTVMPRNYCFNLNEATYIYYRVKAVIMNWQYEYSVVINTREQPANTPLPQHETATTTRIAKNTK